MTVGDRRRRRTRAGPGSVLRLAATALLAFPSACADPGGTDEALALERERFVSAYVDLRMATLRAGVDNLPASTRDSILSAHGVTDEDLLRFVEVHGRDAQLMHAVWDTIEDRIDRMRSVGSADSTGPLPAPDTARDSSDSGSGTDPSEDGRPAA